MILKCFLQYHDECSKCFLVLLSYAILKLSGLPMSFITVLSQRVASVSFTCCPCVKSCTPWECASLKQTYSMGELKSHLIRWLEDGETCRPTAHSWLPLCARDCFPPTLPLSHSVSDRTLWLGWHGSIPLEKSATTSCTAAGTVESSVHPKWMQCTQTWIIFHQWHSLVFVSSLLQSCLAFIVSSEKHRWWCETCWNLCNRVTGSWSSAGCSSDWTVTDHKACRAGSFPRATVS